MRSTSRTGPAAVSDAAPAAAPWIGGGTRTVGVIGWPVSHSLSPLIHNAAFAALEMDWAYVPLPVPPGNVLEALRGLRALGFAGANVTMPHKTEIAALVDELTDDARLLWSVNTLVVTTDAIVGHNTDCPGFDRFITRDAGFDAAHKTALVFGAGGAARACAVALARARLRELVRRRPSRARGPRVERRPAGGARATPADPGARSGRARRRPPVPAAPDPASCGGTRRRCELLRRSPPAAPSGRTRVRAVDRSAGASRRHVRRRDDRARRSGRRGNAGRLIPAVRIPRPRHLKGVVSRPDVRMTHH